MSRIVRSLGVRPEAVILACAAALLLVRLVTAPPPWWDEGWTLSVVRTWVETGHYGRLLAGEPISPKLAAAPTVVLPVALSFLLLGVGAWQGRLTGVLWTLLALWLLYRLATALYDRKTGFAALVLALAVPVLDGLQPLLLGRQVLGEMPGVCFLIAGFLLYRPAAARRGTVYACVAGGLWGLAAITKVQLFPFIALSAGAASVLLGIRQNKAGFLRSLLALLVACGLPLVYQSVAAALWPSPGHGWSTEGLLGVTALVLDFSVRLHALAVVLAGGLPMVTALACTGRRRLVHQDPRRAAVWVFAASSLAWYLLLSNGLVRYLFPSAFLSAIFLARLIRGTTRAFDPEVLGNMVRGLHPRHWVRLARAQKWTMILLALPVGLTAVGFSSALLGADGSVFRLAEYMTASVPREALVETYDAEIFFLVQQPVHYPGDQLHVQAIRRRLYGEGAAVVDYDPLEAGPGYLVVGPFSRKWEVYPPDLLGEHFRLVKQFGRYDLYRSVDAPEP